jgi:SOS-response transcriptional repressor LexA
MNNEIDYPEILDKLLKEKQISVNKLANVSGIPQPTLYKIVKGITKDPSLTVMKTIADGLGVSVLAFLQGERSVGEVAFRGKYQQAPLLSMNQAAYYTEIRAENIEQWYMCPIPSGKDVFCLKVVGDSMAPDYKEGELIFIDPDKEYKSGSVVFVVDRANEFSFATLKVLVQEFSGPPKLKALNPEWQPKYIDFTNTMKIIGPVIGKFVPVL